MEEDQSLSSLLQFMEGKGLVPSFEDEEQRRNVVAELVEARNKESDIDAVCVGPYFATMAEKRHIRDIPCEGCKSSVAAVTFEGILVDLPYAQLKVLSVPKIADSLDFSCLSVDETSLKSLAGVRSNNSILKLVPNLENFCLLLRCAKLWAKRREIYGNLFGFLGGVHLAIPSAYVCQRKPEALLTVLISELFRTFALWQWPTPVVLEDAMSSKIEDTAEFHTFMPIRLPCSPYQLCQSNITRSTFDKIRVEFLQSHTAMKELSKPKFRLNNLFQYFPYLKKYTRFLKIYLSATSKYTFEDGLAG